MRSFRVKLQYLWQRGCSFLGTDYAILGGAMTWVSDHNLVSAISNAGGFGVIASGSMSPAQLSDEIQKTVKLTSRPFGVNLITMHPELEALIDVCAR
ncbi:MAG: 2-nitropropane dioxygenase, partial [Alphaproteobacteria bacterium]|nr:2-nitropropane dioxygenase [Alphaproteobacteria bacterium]